MINKLTIKQPRLKILQTVKTGIYKSSDEALSCFKAEGGNYRFQTEDYHFKIGGYAYEAIKNLSFGIVEERRLTLISVRQLGFSLHHVPCNYVRAAMVRKKEIEFCTGEDFFLFRLAFRNQKFNDKILVPINREDREDKMVFFRLERHNNSVAGRSEYWILDGSSNSIRFCNLDELFLVRLLKFPFISTAATLLGLLESIKQAKIKKET